MPTWRNTLPPEGKHMGFSLHRTPSTGDVRAVITSDDLLVCDTHFWHGRTMPCERLLNDQGHTIDDSPCHPCREKVAYRTHCYVAAYDSKKSEHFIFECTTHAAKAFAEYREATGSLRGCAFRASRPKGTPNGKVLIETAPSNLAKYPLPQPPNVVLALAVIWRLPLTGLAIEHDTTSGMNDQAGYARKNPTVHTKPDRMRPQRTQPDNMPEPPTIGEVLSGNGKPKKEPVPS